MTDLSESGLLVFSLSTLALGMIILIRAADALIDGAVFIANKAGISPLLVGFTIVAFGTSLPELIVSINANFKDSPGVAIGNVIGSNIANILLILGVSALFGVIAANRKALALDMGKMMLATFICIGLMFYGSIPAAFGAAMVVTLIGYVALQYRNSLRQSREKTPKLTPEAIPHEDADHAPAFASVRNAALFALAGVIGVAGGAELMVRGAITSAQILHVPDAIIGLTVVAVGTSLPELSTSIVAAMRKQGDIILGNIIGSNVFNVMMILGVMSILKPVSLASLPAAVLNFDVWVMLGSAALLCGLVVFRGQIGRVSGAFLVGGYVAYLAALTLMNT